MQDSVQEIEKSRCVSDDFLQDCVASRVGLRSGYLARSMYCQYDIGWGVPNTVREKLIRVDSLTKVWILHKEAGLDKLTKGQQLHGTPRVEG